jgi:hypothetical protein
MGSFANPNGAANVDLHSFILGKMKGLRRSSVVSINSSVKDIRTATPSCSLSNERLIKLITETAMLLGLVPVLGRRQLAYQYGQFGGAYDNRKPSQRRDLERMIPKLDVKSDDLR